MKIKSILNNVNLSNYIKSKIYWDSKLYKTIELYNREYELNRNTLWFYEQVLKKMLRDVAVYKVKQSWIGYSKEYLDQVLENTIKIERNFNELSIRQKIILKSIEDFNLTTEKEQKKILRLKEIFYYNLISIFIVSSVAFFLSYKTNIISLSIFIFFIILYFLILLTFLVINLIKKQLNN
jgi:hypothetical protein